MTELKDKHPVQSIEKLLDEVDALVESNPIPTLMWIDIRKLIITAYDFQEFVVECLKDKLGFFVNVSCEW